MNSNFIFIQSCSPFFISTTVSGRKEICLNLASILINQSVACSLPCCLITDVGFAIVNGNANFIILKKTELYVLIFKYLIIKAIINSSYVMDTVETDHYANYRLLIYKYIIRKSSTHCGMNAVKTYHYIY